MTFWFLVHRELRVRSRKRWTWILRTGTALAATVLAIGTLLATGVEEGWPKINRPMDSQYRKYAKKPCLNVAIEYQICNETARKQLRRPLTVRCKSPIF
jgi:hypothetical protein